MKVRLQDVIDALKYANMGTKYYYSGKNEDIVMVLTGVFVQPESRALARDIEAHPGDYVPLPDPEETDEYAMMEEFIETLPKEKQKIFFDDIYPTGAFRNFEKRLEAEGLTEAWLRYRNAEYDAFARSWCDYYGLEIIE